MFLLRVPIHRCISIVCRQYQYRLLDKVNSRYGETFKLDDLKEFDSSIRNCGSSSFLWKIKEFLINKLEKSGKNTKYVEDLFTNHASDIS